MCGVDSNHSFKCLACTSPKHLLNLHSLQVHFASEHGVVNLLSSPATQAVVPLCTFSCHATSCKPEEFYASCLFCGATALTEEEMRLHLRSRHGVFFQHNWKQYCSHHCRCYAEVQWGWGNEIQSLGTPTEQGESKAVKGKSKILDGKRAVGVESFGGHTSCSQKSSGEGEIVTGIQTIRPKLIKKNRVVSQAGGKERDSEEGCLDNVQTRQTLAAVPKEAAECSKEVGKSESEVSLSLDLVNGKQDKETLYSGKLDEPRKMRMMSEVQGEVVEKKLYFKKRFTRGLTDKGGKLVNEIQNESGARVDIIPSPGIEQTVVLKGPLLLVENAERMLMELQSSVLEINLGYEEINILEADGWCLMTKLRRRLQVSVRLEGSKLMLMGKPEDTKRDSEVLKEELRRILKEPVRVEVPEGHEVKKLTLDKTFTKALTSNGGKLVKEIQYR